MQQKSLTQITGHQRQHHHHPQQQRHYECVKYLKIKKTKQKINIKKKETKKTL